MDMCRALRAVAPRRVGMVVAEPSFLVVRWFGFLAVRAICSARTGLVVTKRGFVTRREGLKLPKALFCWQRLHSHDCGSAPPRLKKRKGAAGLPRDALCEPPESGGHATGARAVRGGLERFEGDRRPRFTRRARPETSSPRVGRGVAVDAAFRQSLTRVSGKDGFHPLRRGSLACQRGDNPSAVRHARPIVTRDANRRPRAARRDPGATSRHPPVVDARRRRPVVAGRVGGDVVARGRIARGPTRRRVRRAPRVPNRSNRRACKPRGERQG